MWTLFFVTAALTLVAFVMSLWGSDRRSAQRHQVGIHHKLLTNLTEKRSWSVSHKKHSRMRAMLVVAITITIPVRTMEMT
jgi:uncharacterized membrane protein YsdA (DUF1294 family)